MIRTFIGVQAPEEVREAIGDDMRRLRAAAPGVKWVRPENFHLTLKFLGDVKENDLGELFDALSAALKDHGAFALAVEGVFALPNWRHPRVVAAGTGDGAEEMRELNAIVEAECAALGYTEEKRPYKPHLTLGRVKIPEDARALPEAVEALGDPFYGFVDVDEVVVFMSELRRSGPVYSPMHRIGLSSHEPS